MKNVNNKRNKIFYISLILVLSVLVTLYNNKLDNDIWYILTQGRYIVQNGLIYTLLYKICMLISDNNKFLSIICSVVTDIFLIMYYIVSRGKIFSFVLLLSVIYFLEKYIKTNNGKYLIILSIISLLQINLHASLWLMIFLYSLPYIIDGMKFKKYDFTHLIVELDEVRNYLISEENNDFIVYYADEINGIYLYARKDLLSKEKIKELEKMDYFDSEVHFYRY